VKVRAGVGAVAWSDGQEVEAEVRFELPADALTLVGEAPSPANYAVHVNAVAERNGLSPALLEAVVWQESRWRPTAVSPKGAQGLAQLMPGTARELGVDPRDPVANLEGGARYLRQQLNRFGGDVERALAAYNAGPGRVTRAGGVPNIPETRAYVAAILGRLQAQAVSR
jgi:soluble lytic murein transglycosylase-like protein